MRQKESGESDTKTKEEFRAFEGEMDAEQVSERKWKKLDLEQQRNPVMEKKGGIDSKKRKYRYM